MNTHSHIGSHEASVTDLTQIAEFRREVMPALARLANLVPALKRVSDFVATELLEPDISRAAGREELELVDALLSLLIDGLADVPTSPRAADPSHGEGVRVSEVDAAVRWVGARCSDMRAAVLRAL